MVTVTLKNIRDKDGYFTINIRNNSRDIGRYQSNDYIECMLMFHNFVKLYDLIITKDTYKIKVACD